MEHPKPAVSAARGFALVCALASGLGGCVDIPSPLAPQLGGSVGLPHHGVVTGAVAMPKKGPGYVLFRDDGVRYGVPRLVETVRYAAAKVAEERPGSPPLVIGDLSLQHGGPNERHRSHRSGRDVDLIYFVTTPEGAPVKSPGFIRFGADGLAESPTKGKYLRLDVARTWLLVKALITAPDSDVQWLFMSRPIEGLVTEHARALGEDPELVWYAETVMQQPSDSAVHDDHIHMRLACSPADAVAGCAGGPRWPFLPELPELEISAEEELSAILD